MTLIQNLEQLRDSDLYPYHMPGHKRQGENDLWQTLHGIDITEIDDYDNLHAAEGILKEAQERANRLYGAEETFFLVNGSTCGVLSALSAVADEGDRVLVCRNGHKSMYHACYLRKLDMEYLLPEWIPEEGIFGRLLPKTLEDAILRAETAERESGSAPLRAVFLTSPTYEGIPSDIRALAEIAHSHHLPLIVDAAHGAHFGLGEDLPASAVAQGADLVIHSLHKTLPSMTQTSLLHVRGNLVNRDRLRRFLRIYQSSSPSYVLMASIDHCMERVEREAQQMTARLLDLRHRIAEGTADCRIVTILGQDRIPDPCKLVVSGNGIVTGQAIYDALRERYHLQAEMAGEKNCLLILTSEDTDEGVDRLIRAVQELDREATDEAGREFFLTRRGNGAGCQTEPAKAVADFRLPGREVPLYQAWDADAEWIPIAQAEGRIAAEFVNLYPPGIPLIAPGEVFDESVILHIRELAVQGMNLQGVRDGKSGCMIYCMNTKKTGFDHG